ncbi:unnamed protein product [Ectocarpus sp. CCAP 1310/34]|nr:unnamed protein product [Ectocarpus sp. CCAP 1310/34]
MVEGGGVQAESHDRDNGKESVMPPLPAKKSPGTSGAAASNLAKQLPAVSPRAISSLKPDTADGATFESYLSYKPANGEDTLAVYEAVNDPSKWLLKNKETGQEVEATAFADTLLARRPAPQCATVSPRLGSHSHGSRGWPRLQRHKAPAFQRPSLLPPSNGDIAYFPPASAGPLTPPFLQLGFSSLSGRSSPLRFGASLSVSGQSFSRPRSGSNSHGRSNSDSTTSSVILSVDALPSFKLGNMSTTQLLPKLHPGGVRAMSFSPSGAFLATCGMDRRCCVFRVQKHRQTTALGEGSPNAAAAAVGLPVDRGMSRQPNSVSVEGRLVDDQPLRVLTGHVDSVVALAWVGGDNALLTGSSDGTVRCWHPLEGNECSEVYEHGGGVTSVAWEPGGEVRGGRFLTGCMDARIRLFSLDSPEVEQSVLSERAVTAVAFCPGGQRFAAGGIAGNVEFYRMDDMSLELTVECRRHGFRHSAAQRTRLATSPVRRLSVGTGDRRSNGAGGDRIQTNDNGNTNGRSGRGRDRRRRKTLGSSAGARAPGTVEVTGLCFRPQTKGPAEPTGDCSDSDGEDHRLNGKMGEYSQEVAPSPRVGGEVVAPHADEKDANGSGNLWVERLEADLLVSTNDNRLRILVSEERGVTVGFKLKGHSTEGELGRHTAARYSDDGNFIVSGATDGSVHVWSTPTTPPGTKSVTWASGREGHERARVCDKRVGVPVAFFAPASVAKNLGGTSSRVIVTGDNEGNCKIFSERRADREP